MNPDSAAPGSKSALLIALLVVVGITTLAAGGYLAWSRRRVEPPVEVSDAVNAWCSLRGDWARQVEPLGADIMLKNASGEQEQAEALKSKRTELCHDYGKKLESLGIADPALQAVEIALIKEGKTRANINVEIFNRLSEVESKNSIGELREILEELRVGQARRIQQGKAQADEELAKAMAPLGGSCSKIYRGPVTDEGTSGNPYVSWSELDLQRTAAIKRVEERIKELEPLEEYTNRVYHELIRRYRPVLTSCYKRIKAKNFNLSEKMDLRVRLKRDGSVRTLAIEYMDPEDERLLDCFLEKAAHWRLPRPDPGIDYVVVSLDLAHL